MPKDRVQVGDLSAPEGLRPIAQAVSTYVHPGQRRSGSLERVAEAVSRFSPALLEYTRNKEDEEVAQVASKARLDRRGLAQDVKDFHDATNRGLIPKDHNPYYKIAWEDADAKLRANAALERINQEYSNWPDRDQVSPEEFNAWLAEQVAGEAAKLPEGQVYIDKLTAKAREGSINLGRAQSAARSKALDAQYAGAFESEVYDAFQTGMQPGEDGKPKATLEQIWSTVNAAKDRARIAAGYTGAQVNEMTLAAIINTAEAMGSTDILKAADQTWKDPATGQLIPGPGSIKGARAKLLDAKDRIETAQATEAKAREQLFKKQKEEYLGQAYTDAVGGIMDNPFNPISSDIRNRLLAGGPDGVKHLKSLMGFRKALLGEQDALVDPTDDALFTSYWQQTGDLSVLINGYNAGKVSKSTLLTESKRTQRIMRGLSDDVDATSRTPLEAAKRHKKLGSTVKTFGASLTKKTPIGRITRRMENWQRKAIEMDHLEMLTNWHEKHPDADDLELAKYSKEIEDFLISKINDKSYTFGKEELPDDPDDFFDEDEEDTEEDTEEEAQDARSKLDALD